MTVDAATSVETTTAFKYVGAVSAAPWGGLPGRTPSPSWRRHHGRRRNARQVSLLSWRDLRGRPGRSLKPGRCHLTGLGADGSCCRSAPADPIRPAILCRCRPESVNSTLHEGTRRRHSETKRSGSDILPCVVQPRVRVPADRSGRTDAPRAARRRRRELRPRPRRGRRAGRASRPRRPPP